MHNRRVRARNTGRANDRRGDIESLGKNPPQVKAKNQAGHPRPKDLIADGNARRDYFGGAGSKRDAPLYKPFVSMFDDTANASEGGSKAPVYHMPLSRSFGSKDNWTRVSMGSDDEAERKLVGNPTSTRDGFVMGQRVGRFCPKCNLALPVKADKCIECNL
jgi:hypothetical protein